MIEIYKRNENWEAYVNGTLFTYSEDLETVLNFLASHTEEIKNDILVS
jgi:hypothetical protein